MPPCCRCNGSGRCLNCACVKAGKICTNCLPHRRGKCSNRATHPPPPPPPARVSDSPQRPPSCGFPEFVPIATGVFTWGEVDSSAFSTSIKAAYSEVVNWKRNIFTVPSGTHGKRFVNELARLIRAYADASAMEGVALYAAMVMPALLLQRPHRTSKTRDHRACLERRLPLWEAGDFHSLLQEGRCIQQKLRRQSFHHSPDDESDLTRRFTNFMHAGKTKDAVRLLSDQEKGGVLHLSDPVETTDAGGRTVHDTLVSKHPPGQPAHPDALIHDEDMGVTDPIQTHPVLFDSIDAAAIHSATLDTFGAAGPSSLDARNWRIL